MTLAITVAGKFRRESLCEHRKIVIDLLLIVNARIGDTIVDNRQQAMYSPISHFVDGWQLFIWRGGEKRDMMMVAMAEQPDQAPIGYLIGQRIKQAARERGITQGQLVYKTGMDKGTVSLMLRGARVDPPIGTVIRFAEALGVSIDELVGIKPLPEIERLAVEDMTTETLRRELLATNKRQLVTLQELQSIKAALEEAGILPSGQSKPRRKIQPA